MWHRKLSLSFNFIELHLCLKCKISIYITEHEITQISIKILSYYEMYEMSWNTYETDKGQVQDVHDDNGYGICNNLHTGG